MKILLEQNIGGRWMIKSLDLNYFFTAILKEGSLLPYLKKHINVEDWLRHIEKNGSFTRNK